jgi:hypothetical protein
MNQPVYSEDGKATDKEPRLKFGIMLAHRNDEDQKADVDEIFATVPGEQFAAHRHNPPRRSRLTEGQGENK